MKNGPCCRYLDCLVSFKPVGFCCWGIFRRPFDFFFKTPFISHFRHFTVLSFIQPPMANIRDESVITTEQSRPKVLSTETFTCPLCSSILTSRSHFLHHVGTEHGESFFAVCKTCMQCFSPKEIDSHMSACKGSFVCPYCRQTFALLPYLNRHIRRKHSIDDENRAPSGAGNGLRYPCKFCSKTYSSNNSLNDHIRKHLNCVCKLCGSRLICKSKKEFATCGACGTLMSLDHGEYLWPS